MPKSIQVLFTDKDLISKIQERLPKLFQIAESESSRAGKIGMEVGSLRERILVALLIHSFGEEHINTEIPITESEIDVMIDGNPLSIKTITGGGGVKAVWTVDAQSSINFVNNYAPKCDILLVQIWWETDADSFYLIPLQVQKDILARVGKSGYLNLPKAGTNPRGVEFSKNALNLMLNHKNTMKIKINWRREKMKYKIFDRWVKYWD